MPDASTKSVRETKDPFADGKGDRGNEGLKSMTILLASLVFGLLFLSDAGAQGEAQWEKTVAAAKKEGELSIYLNAPAQVRPALTKAFDEKFGIKIYVVTGTGPELSAKIVSEYSAGLHQADVSFQGCSTLITLIGTHGYLTPIEPMLILPEVKDGKLWFGGKLNYDKAGTAVRFINHALPPLVYNTELVKPSSIQSYLDLQKPEWKKKILMHDPSILGAGANGISYLATLWGLNKAKDYLSALLKAQEAGVTRNYQQHVEWVGQGKYAVALWPNPGQAARYVKAGAPITVTHLKEGAVASPAFGCLGVPAKPAHPNATAVFVNWFLSREGQTLAVKAYELPSARLDVTAAGVLKEFVIAPEQKIFVENEEFNAMQDKWMPEWKAVVESVQR
jgi:iron(III) transport system substrate-binding protein